MYADGSKIFKQLGKEYVQHKVGFFILAPSGSGKTHFCKRQKSKHWMDGDELWEATKAAPTGKWWLEGEPAIFEIDQRCDVITAKAKKLGFWVMGASNYWLPPDAIVLPHWSTHKRYIKNRETYNYDGGATSDALKIVLRHRRWIRKRIKQGVPTFGSVDAAVQFLTRRHK